MDAHVFVTEDGNIHLSCTAMGPISQSNGVTGVWHGRSTTINLTAHIGEIVREAVADALRKTEQERTMTAHEPAQDAPPS